MGYRPLVNFHLFSLTKWFPITPSVIYICIDKTVPGFLDVTVVRCHYLCCLAAQLSSFGTFDSFLAVLGRN